MAQARRIGVQHRAGRRDQAGLTDVLEPIRTSDRRGLQIADSVEQDDVLLSRLKHECRDALDLRADGTDVTKPHCLERSAVAVSMRADGALGGRQVELRRPAERAGAQCVAPTSTNAIVVGASVGLRHACRVPF